MSIKTEKQKMIEGEYYNATDSQLSNDRNTAHKLCNAYSQGSNGWNENQRSLLAELGIKCGTDVYIEPPFFCDYGFNIELGDNTYLNTNCVILDSGLVKFGRRVMLGPCVQVYSVTHPLESKARAKLLEYAKPITISDDVWIGGGAIILPGVHIGEGSVIGAGSVVTKDIPANVVAAGNPCVVIKNIDQESMD